jgi:hypothetical protein
MTHVYLTTRATAPDDDHSNWNFMGSLYFCFTVITTIGYGNYTPNTETGRLFCIFYALVGIPSFVVMATIISESILNTVRLVMKVSRAYVRPRPSLIPELDWYHHSYAHNDNLAHVDVKICN